LFSPFVLWTGLNTQTLSVFNEYAAFMLFPQHLADKILSGEKTQTRRSTERKRGVRVYEVGEKAPVQVGSARAKRLACWP
jgi:hypothetical protein